MHVLIICIYSIEYEVSNIVPSGKSRVPFSSRKIALNSIVRKTALISSVVRNHSRCFTTVTALSIGIQCWLRSPMHKCRGTGSVGDRVRTVLLVEAVRTVLPVETVRTVALVSTAAAGVRTVSESEEVEEGSGGSMSYTTQSPLPLLSR